MKILLILLLFISPVYAGVSPAVMVAPAIARNNMQLQQRNCLLLQQKKIQKEKQEKYNTCIQYKGGNACINILK